MVNELFSWLLDIPRVIAQFGSWLTSPLYPPYISISPLALFGISGFSVLIFIIGLHVVRLFI